MHAKVTSYWFLRLKEHSSYQAVLRSVMEFGILSDIPMTNM